MRALLLALVALLLAAPAYSHDSYANWVNKAEKGCCNNTDCRPISDADVRIIGGSYEVDIGKEWCRVLPHHFLKTGNAPDWSTAHVCIRSNDITERKHGFMGSQCHRLLCFQPKAQF